MKEVNSILLVNEARMHTHTHRVLMPTSEDLKGYTHAYHTHKEKVLMPSEDPKSL